MSPKIIFRLFGSFSTSFSPRNFNMFFSYAVTFFVHPINCILISEEVKPIMIILEERNSFSLKGKLVKGNKVFGEFRTRKPSIKRASKWYFNFKNRNLHGDIILFKGNLLWHAYQNKIKSYDVDRALFSGLATNIKPFTNDKELLKASSGFFQIGKGCYGGRIKKS